MYSDTIGAAPPWFSRRTSWMTKRGAFKRSGPYKHGRITRKIVGRIAPAASGLGFTLPKWLTPPKTIRNIVGSIAGAMLKGTTVTVPTPAGTQTFDLGNPSDRAFLEKMAAGLKISRTPEAAPGAVSQADKLVTEHVPGGWLTLAAAGAGLFLFMGRRGR
jgi:hypothetical protein